MGKGKRLSNWWQKLRETIIEIRTVRKVIDLKTGKELTEANDGCEVHGYLVDCETKSLIEIGGRGSRGFVVPSKMLERYSQKTLEEGFKFHLLQRIDSEPILVITSSDINIKINREK